MPGSVLHQRWPGHSSDSGVQSGVAGGQTDDAKDRDDGGKNGEDKSNLLRAYYALSFVLST